VAMNKGLEGVVPPMITSFNAEGEIDKNALKNVINFLSRHVHGLFICGSYGLGPLMREDQRKQCAEIVMEQVGEKIPVIVHVGVTNTKTAVSLAKHAENVGASYVSSVPPFYYQHTEENILKYYQELVESVSIPVYVYNNPRTVGYAISTELLNRLAEIGVIGVKDSSFSIMILSDFLRKVKKSGFDVVLGTEALFLPASVLGIKAFIPGLGNAFPEIVVELYETCRRGDYERARDVQRKILALRDIMHIGGSTIVAVYEMLRMRGINAGLPKPPYYPLNKKMREEMHNALKDMAMV